MLSTRTLLIMRSIAVSVLAGLLAVTAYPPIDWGVMSALPAVTLLLWALVRAQSWWQAGLSGMGFGLSFFGLLIYWLSELGWIALFPLLLVLSLYPGLYGLLLFSFRRLSMWGFWIMAVGGWGFMEFIRTRFPLQGFAWGLLGHSASDLSLTRNPAALVGVSGISVAIVGVAAAAVLWFRPDRDFNRLNRLWAVVATGVGVLLVLGLVTRADRGDEKVRVAIVQGSTPCVGSHCNNERFRTYTQHLQLTQTLSPRTIDLVVWPESSAGGNNADPVLDPEVGLSIAAEAQRLEAGILVGSDRVLTDEDWENVNIVFDPEGAVVGEYQKQHPVPFGEYIPARDWFTWIEDLEAVPRDMIRGDGPVVFDVGFGTFGSVISFEGAFSRYARAHIREGARLLVLATNQGSYPYSPASDQFIAISRLRATELGVGVVHAAVTGRSTLIDSHGNYDGETAKGESVLYTGSLGLDDGRLTPYARWGDWLQILAIGAAVITVLGVPLHRLRHRLRS